MDAQFFIILFTIIIGFGVVIFVLKNQNQVDEEDPEDKKHEQQLFLMMQQQIQELQRTVDSKLSESNRHMQLQFGQSSKIIKDVTEKLTKLDETNKQVVNFADQLQNLQDILQNPKQRGILGEFYLETVLKNVLPPSSFQMQYNLGKCDDGKDLIVDAALFVKDKIIPIDAKFSLENYNRLLQEKNPENQKKLETKFKNDLKARIDETSKYIKPEYNTLDFAFMFIPAEAIYYDLLVNQVGAVKVSTQDLIEYAFQEKKVIIVSPTSFFAYLQTVLQGLRALQIEESAKEIRKRVTQLGKHMKNYDDYMQKLGNNLGTTVNSYNKAYKEFNKIDKDVMRIEDRKEKLIDPLELDKPKAHIE